MSNWTTTKNDESTHMIDDGGCLYWIAAPGKTNDDVADLFRAGYDGTLEEFDVTDLEADERSDYEA